MFNKELKRLSRRELVDIIYQLKKNEQQLEEEIISLKKELQDKRIRISKAGSIAEASMNITDIFSAAQKTADIYLKEIAQMKEETEKECEKKLAEADAEVKKIMADGEKQFTALKTCYQFEHKKCQQLFSEIQVLELRKNSKKHEGVENGTGKEC